MDIDSIFQGMSVSSSGLAAERRRLDVIARNIANANVVAAPGGEPFRRQEVVFQTILEDRIGKDEIAGAVRVKEVVTDTETPAKEIYDPNHPMADPSTGLVTYSNVDMTFEMVDLMSASRAYEANLKAMGVYRDMAMQALRLLEG